MDKVLDFLKAIFSFLSDLISKLDPWLRNVVIVLLIIFICFMVWLIVVNKVIQQTQVPITPTANNSALPTKPTEPVLTIDSDSITNNTISGTHTLPLNSFVWIVLWDGIHYYLQNPRVTLEAGGRWYQGHVIVGNGIKKIFVVKVTSEGNETFRGMVRNNQWGGFDELPPGSDTLDSGEPHN